jgi:hypothetical protein
VIQNGIGHDVGYGIFASHGPASLCGSWTGHASAGARARSSGEEPRNHLLDSEEHDIITEYLSRSNAKDYSPDLALLFLVLEGFGEVDQRRETTGLPLDA